MTEEKFTQGEWKVEEKSVSLKGITRFGFQVISPEKRKRVCYSETDEEKNIPEMQANAALIAAAPKMYALLSMMVSPTIMMGQTMRNDDLRTAIEAVLKKARGEE